MATPTIPVSVNLIVRNCAASLDACLGSLGRFLTRADEIVIVDTGSTDQGATAAVARRHGARLIERPDLCVPAAELASRWLPAELRPFAGESVLTDFAAARTVAMEVSRHDCIFWIDSDDTLWERHPGQLRAVVDQGFGKHYDVLLLQYEYWFDRGSGRCVSTLRRERIVDRRRYHWHGRCHETLVPVRPDDAGRAAYYYDLPVTIRHSSHRDDSRYASARNYLIMRSEVEADLNARRAPSSRTSYYLANACRGLGLLGEAERHYRAAIDGGASPDNRYSALQFIAEICLTPPNPRLQEAMDAGRECVRAAPQDPRGHYIVSRALAEMQRWEESLKWFEQGRQLPGPETNHAFNPDQVEYFPLVVAARAAIELKRLDCARGLVAELSRQRPDYPDTAAIRATLERALQGW